MDFSEEVIPIPEGIYENICKYLKMLIDNPNRIYKCSYGGSSGPHYIEINDLNIWIYNDCFISVKLFNIQKEYGVNNRQRLNLLSIKQDVISAANKALSYHLKVLVEDTHEEISKEDLFDYAIKDES